MRRKERACDSPEFVNDVLCHAEILHIAFRTDDFPYVIPVNFVFYDGTICVHCALEGLKTDLLKRDPRVGFTLYTGAYIDTAKATTRYKCLCGTGKAEMVDDVRMKQDILASLARKYKSECRLPLTERTASNTGVFRILIESLTGKKNSAE